ncbi:hypothetical protein [Photobacterium obscurum]|nr:hypothetical protein [Photobacterium obscurum]
MITNFDFEPCPYCGQYEEYWVDEEREIVTCICGAVILQPVLH